MQRFRLFCSKLYSMYYSSPTNQDGLITFAPLLKIGFLFSKLIVMRKLYGTLTNLCANIYVRQMLMVQDPLQK